MSAAIQEFREALAAVAVDASLTTPTQTLKRHTRGIVISGGGELQFVNAYATMRVYLDKLLKRFSMMSLKSFDTQISRALGLFKSMKYPYKCRRHFYTVTVPEK